MVTTKKKRSGRFELSMHDLKKLAIAFLVLLGGWFVTHIHDVQAFFVERGMDEGTAMMIISFGAYFANKLLSDYTKDA